MTEAENISIDESVLLDRWRRGDRAAMERMILRYQGRIYNVILRMCGNADDAAELTQETFVKIIENIAKFRGKSSFYTWAFRIAVNLTINYCKRSVRLGLRSLDAESGQEAEEGRRALAEFLDDKTAADPAQIIENKEAAELVVKALMQLEDSHRAIIVLRDIEGMDYAQMAEVFGVELGTVKSRLSRARGDLRDILEVLLK